MVDLYVSDITDLPDPKECPEFLDRLTEERQAKIRRMSQSRSRRQSLGAGLLLEKVLVRYGLCSRDVYVDDSGKPQIKGLFFNLSHSGEMVVCAVSSRPVGCDVEQLKEAPQNLVERFFCEGEKQYLHQFTGDKYDEEFYRLWTMKESYMKYTGEGTCLPLKAFEILMDDEVKVLRDGMVQDCYMKEYVVCGYRVTVCAEESRFAELIWENI